MCGIASPYLKGYVWYVQWYRVRYVSKICAGLLLHMGSNEAQLFAPYGLLALVPIELPALWWPVDFDGDCHQEKDGQGETDNVL